MKKNKITIEWHSLLKDVIRNIWVVMLSALIGVLGFYIVTQSTYKPAYTSSATLAVLTGGVDSGSYSTLTVSSQKADVLVNVLTEPSVKEAAAKYLEIESFEGTVSAYVLEGTNFIELQVTSNHPEKAYTLLNAILKSHHEVSGKIFKNASITIIRMPSVPVTPSNRIESENRTLVALAFATLSFVAVVAISLTRNTIKRESDFNEKIDSKLIGTIAHEDKKMSLKEIRQKKKKGLLIHNNAHISLRFSESFHKIAAKIEHSKNRTGSRVLAITSVAENEGKSTCATNIAVSLADRGSKVVLVDFDFKKPAIYKIFGEEHKEENELSDLLSSKTDYENFEFRQFKKTSLSLVLNTKPASEYQKWVENGSVDKLIAKLEEDFDFVIIDTAPLSLDASVTDIIQKVDKTILIVRTDTVNINVINDFIATISKISENLAGCILNDVYMNILPFSFTGNDESNYYGVHRYGKYSHYSRYGNYSHYHHKKPLADEEVFTPPAEDSLSADEEVSETAETNA